MHWWDRFRSLKTDTRSEQFYSLPFNLNKFFPNIITYNWSFSKNQWGRLILLAIDAAVLVIQHPDGRLERMFRPVPASQVMRANPGHYVSLIIPLTNEGRGEEGKEEGEGTKKREVRFTRVKLIRPTETLDLGHAYRLVTSQEVMKVLRAKKYGKMMKQRQQQEEQLDEVVVVQQQGKPETGFAGGDHGKENNNNNSHNQGMKQQRHGQTVVGSGSRPKSWRPNLQSIAEGSTRTS